MKQHVQRLWNGPATVGIVTIAGVDYTILLSAITPCTLTDLATRFHVALETATHVGWAVTLGTDYTISFALDTAGAFTWAQSYGWGDFWGVTDDTDTSRVGTAWTAAADTDWGIVLSMPIIVPHREIFAIPSADPVGVLYAAHTERTAIVRDAPDSPAALLLQSEPCIIYQGDGAAWSWANLDGYIRVRPASSQGQASSPWVEGMGTVLEYQIRLIDLTASLPT